MENLLRRFFEAVTLCTGERAIKPRLAEAWVEHLDAVDPGKLPTGLRVKFRMLRTAMYREQPLPGEHAARASVRKMSQQEAAEYTHSIVVIHRELMRIHFDNRQPVTQTASERAAGSEAAYEGTGETLLN